MLCAAGSRLPHACRQCCHPVVLPRHRRAAASSSSAGLGHLYDCMSQSRTSRLHSRVGISERSRMDARCFKASLI
uniref:Uncharacterized protein n=1 Tax=Leersia perrieri TaxID=77586 RepID=A0A0D9X5D2_9ORYZ